MRNSVSNFREYGIPTLRNGEQLQEGEQLGRGEGRGPGPAGTLWRRAAEGSAAAVVLRFFQQFLGLSRRSQPLPLRLHLPRCGGGSKQLGLSLPTACVLLPRCFSTPSPRTVGYG